MPSQTQRGISLIVLPLLSERAGERLFFLTPSSSNTTGYPAYYSPSSFGEAQRRGYDGGCFRLWWESFRILEILLQIAQHYCSQINSLSSKTAFVTIKESIGYKEACKRCPFALQNMPFYTSKDALLQCKRASFRTQKGVDYRTTNPWKGRKIEVGVNWLIMRKKRNDLRRSALFKKGRNMQI